MRRQGVRVLLAEGTAGAKALRQTELSTVQAQERDGSGGEGGTGQRQMAPGRQSLAEHVKGDSLVVWSDLRFQKFPLVSARDELSWTSRGQGPRVG